MRWVWFLILAYLLILAQTTVVGLVRLRGLGVENVGPDLLAILAVFLALRLRSTTEAMLAAWVLGLAMELTTSGGPGGGSVLGPMSIAYALSAGGLHRVREAFFRDRVLTQVVLTLGFCLVSYALWVSVQALLARSDMSWSAYGDMMLQAVALGLYTAVLAPLGHWALRRAERLLLAAPTGPRGRR